MQYTLVRRWSKRLQRENTSNIDAQYGNYSSRIKLKQITICRADNSRRYFISPRWNFKCIVEAKWNLRDARYIETGFVLK